MKNLFLQITTLLVLLCACNQKEKYPTKEMITDATEFVVNDIYNNVAFDFELCGHFSQAWNDSILIASIQNENLDSIFSEEDLKYIMNQYSNMENKDVSDYLPNISNYIVENNQEKHLDVHYSISAPLYTISKRSWITFVEVFTRKGYDAYFMVYSINPEKRQISSVLYSNEYVTKPSLKEHKHAFWLNFNK